MSNVYIGEGLLTRFEQKTTPQGTAVYSLSILLPENPNNANKKQGTFVPVEAWPEAISPQVAQELAGKVKQCRVFVKGRLKLDYWQDKTTQANRTSLKIVADIISILPLKKSNQGGSSTWNNPAQQQQQQVAVAAGAGAPQQVNAQVQQVDAQGNVIPF